MCDRGPLSTRADRRVHAVTYKGAEIVRYERAGKWYIEWPDEVRGVGARMRTQATLAAAAKMAVEHGRNIVFGLPGGTAFDARVRRLRGF